VSTTNPPIPPAWEFTARRHPFSVVPVSELHGPSAGVITLPRHVKWSGSVTTYDLDSPIARRTAYKHLLEEGLPEDLRRYVNADLLAADLPQLVIRAEIRKAWQDSLTAAITPH
jgi:hypothetical protein